MEGIVKGLIDLIFPPLSDFCATHLAEDDKAEICPGYLRSIRFISLPHLSKVRPSLRYGVRGGSSSESWKI